MTRLAKIASLDERRAARLGDDVHRCLCGSEWFRMLGANDQPPVVTLSTERSVTGYAAAALVCNECDRMQ